MLVGLGIILQEKFSQFKSTHIYVGMAKKGIYKLVTKKEINQLVTKKPK